MSRWRRAAALLGVVAQSVLGSSLGAQASISLVISGAAGDSMPPAPSFQIATFGTRPDLSYTITLDLSTESAFSRPFFNAQLDSLSATIHLDSLLVQHQRIFIRARLIENQFAGVGVVVDATTRNFAVQGWLKLDSPAQQRTVILNTRTPLFAWSSPGISLPPAPWQYDLTVLNRNTGEQRTKSTTADSVIFDSLEANTSYKWWVTAHAQNSRGNTTVTDTSSGTFVIVSATQPTFTLFYQNFPNPFGRGQRLAMTCFWFDLDHAATVGLTIYDLRLHKVRTIVPGPIGGSQLGAGAYGRTNVDATSGCDNRLSWDGRDDRGNFVPPGVYMARFVADGKSTVIKMLFTGPP
jgi:hypothetical protein